MQRAGAPDRFPNLFVSILLVVFNLEGIVGKQPFHPFIMGDIEQIFPIIHSSDSSGFGLFVVFAFGKTRISPPVTLKFRRRLPKRRFWAALSPNTTERTYVIFAKGTPVQITKEVYCA